MKKVIKIEEFESENSIIKEGRSITKISKELSDTVSKMKELAPTFSSLEGKEKDKVRKVLLDLTANKKELLKELDDAVLGKDKDIELELNESVIGIKTGRDFKGKDLKTALDKAKIKYKMNRLSMTLMVLDLDKKYYDDAKKVVDDLGLDLMTKESLSEDRFGHPITALGNQIYIQLDKMEDMLTGKEKSYFKGSRKTFWDKAKKAMEAEEQKTSESVTEANNFNMVSAKFKDALDDASEISTDSVKKLIKKFKEKRPDAAMEYAKQSFGWMFKEGKVNEKFNKQKLMKAVKKDDGFIQLGDGTEYVIYKYDNGNDDNDEMWGDKTIIALDQDGDEHEVKYSDITSYNESTKLDEKLARGLKPLLKLGLTINKKAGEDALLDLSDKFDELDDEDADDIASHLNMAIELMQDGYPGDATKKLKQFNKVCKDALSGKEVGSAFESKVNEARDSVYIKQLTDTFKKFKLSRKHEIMMDSSYGAGGKIPVLRPKGGFGDGAMIDYDGRNDGKIAIMSSKSGRPIPGESEFTDIDKAMVAATKYVDSIEESVTESRRIQTKRKYTENHPSKTVGFHAKARNKILEAIKDGRITQDDFDNIIKEYSKDGKRWLKRNGKMFNVSEEGISLSRFGKRILKGITINENKNVVVSTFESFVVNEESSLHKRFNKMVNNNLEDVVEILIQLDKIEYNDRDKLSYYEIHANQVEGASDIKDSLTDYSDKKLKDVLKAFESVVKEAKQ